MITFGVCGDIRRINQKFGRLSGKSGPGMRIQKLKPGTAAQSRSFGIFVNADATENFGHLYRGIDRRRRSYVFQQAARIKLFTGLAQNQEQFGQKKQSNDTGQNHPPAIGRRKSRNAVGNMYVTQFR